jgi:hypothetical protein
MGHPLPLDRLLRWQEVALDGDVDCGQPVAAFLGHNCNERVRVGYVLGEEQCPALVGGRDELLPNVRHPSMGMSTLSNTQQQSPGHLPQMQKVSALDGRDTTLHLLALRDSRFRAAALWREVADGVALLLARQTALQRVALWPSSGIQTASLGLVEAAQKQVRAEPAPLAIQGSMEGQVPSQDAALPQEPQAAVGDGPQGELPTQVDGLFRITHYFGARVPTGDGGGYNAPMACHGEMPDAGAAACAPEYCDRHLMVAGIDLVCKDTGALVGPRNIDIFCASLSCWDWACTKRCPTFADWEEVRWVNSR